MPTASERCLVPPALLLGTVCAFVACCLAGRAASRRNLFVRFQRFHHATSPEGMFYPTASQVRALGRELLDRDRIAVVVGGNSVLRGAGQQVATLWTRHLQEELGDGYRVLNLAMDGVFPAEFGGTAAEILTRDFPRLIFVSNVGLHVGDWKVPPAATQAAGVPIAGVFRYFHWDAYSKGLLPTDAARQAAVRAWLDNTRDDRLTELMRGMRLDRLTYSRDLWTTLAYSSFCTYWSRGSPASFTRPRRECPDRGVLEVLRVSHLPSFKDAMVADLRQQVAAGCCIRRLGADNRKWQDIAARLLPPVLRTRTLMLGVRFAPGLVSRLSRQEQTFHDEAHAVLVRGLEGAGVAALAVEAGYTDADFLDGFHLSASGGRKLAAEVAPAIRRLARRLGYATGERGVSTPRFPPARPQLRGLTPPARQDTGGLTPPARQDTGGYTSPPAHHGRDDHADRP